MRVDLVGGDAEGVQTVADKPLVIQPVGELAGRPGALGEPGAKEVVSHAPIGRGKERDRVHQRSAAWYAGVTGGNRERLAELPADVAGNDNRGGARRRPHGEAVSKP